ncbi:MAG TPA: 2-oxoglutarate dehydrogenase, E2 component, dihydrolipoamide succinyltransferase [Streptosporangiaceae bacterium]
MSVSVSMPQLGESVTEGTVTRWLKKEGERVERDEPLLEISTDKVDTEIPSPAAGILRGIVVAEDETVAVGAELATIDDGAGAAGGGAAQDGAAAQADAGPAAAEAGPAAGQDGSAALPTRGAQAPAAQAPAAAPQGPPAGVPLAPPYQQPAAPAPPAPAAPYQTPSLAAPYQTPLPQTGPPRQASPPPAPPAHAPPPAAVPPQAGQPPAAQPPQPAAAAADGQSLPALPACPEGPYVTPLVRKLAAEHDVNLSELAGTGVGGRIRKQDVLDAARVRRESAAAPAAPAAAPPSPAYAAPAGYTAAAPPAVAPQAHDGPAIVPSTLRGTTERMSRLRQVIAQRMVESLQTSAQLTTVVEADVTAIARLRQRAKAEFEAREGVKLSFLPFFALAAIEALKVHPKLNAVLDTQTSQITYHDAEHLGVAVDTDRGLLVPVIRNAGDLNIGGLARKIADLAHRTRNGQVGPDELAGGTFTLTNTGSRGALFDTPIINQPQVAILGTGTVVKRPVVVEDPTLGEVIAVRSIVYLALTYDHRLVDGADAARFLGTVKNRLEEGSFEAELGL